MSPNDNNGAGGFMHSICIYSRANYYRRRAIAAQQCAAQAGDRPSVKACFEEVADHWIALADQLEWLERSSRGIVPAAKP
jgi:hypothetical protein